MNAQSNWAWGADAGGGNEQHGLAVAADSFGNVYITGYIKGNNLNFGPHSVSANGAKDVFIAKYDYNGNNIWVKHAGGSNDDQGLGIAVNANGVYVCGSFNQSMIFYGSPNVTLTSSGGNTDIFVAMLDTAGNVQWAKNAGGGGDEEATAITTDGMNVYITGDFQSTVTFGSLPSLSSAGGTDIFIASYNGITGDENWALRGGGSTADGGTGISFSAGSLYVTGNFGASCSFQNMLTTLTNNSSADAFLAKFSPLGIGLWALKVGGTNAVQSNAVSALGNSVCFAGYFSGSTGFYEALSSSSNNLNAANGQDAFVARYDTLGNFVWAQSENGSGTEAATGIVVNPKGEVLTSGYFTGTLPFGNGPSATATQQDPYITKYDAAGNFLWGAAGSGNNNDLGYGIAAPDNRSAYIVGYFKSTSLAFDTSTAATQGSDDIFLAKIGCTVSVPRAGLDQLMCSPSVTLAGNTPFFGTGTWMLLSGSGTIVSPNSPASSVNGLATGANVFGWTISFNACQSDTDSVMIYRNLSPTPANAGPDRSICSSSYTLTGNTPLVGVAAWHVVSGGGVLSDSTLPSAVITNLSGGQNVLTWKISNSICPVSVDTLKLTVDSMPTPSLAGADQAVCDSFTVLNGNVPLTGTGMWSAVNSSAAFSDTLQPGAQVYDLQVGTNVLVWTISNGACPASQDTVVIEYHQAPSPAIAGPDLEICGQSLVLAAQSPSIGTGHWTNLSAGTISDTLDPQAEMDNLAIGQNYVVWTVVNNYCVSDPDTLLITCDTPPSQADAGTDKMVYASYMTLAAAPPTLGTGMWSVISGSAVFDQPNNPNSYVSGLSEGVNILRWTTYNGVCETHDDLRIEVNKLPVPSGYSPNGDGVNDEFFVGGLQEFGNASLEIFNRWGNRVFESPSYHNDWRGENSSGEKLPDDVYYYLISLDDGRQLSGYVIIKRDK